VTLFSRQRRAREIDAVYADPSTLGDALGDIDVPADIEAWLGRLATLIGVPFGYLVPDEAMLPAESIRFFRLDSNWVDALLDGAFSLGRNLTAEASGASVTLDRAVLPAVTAQARAAAPLRARASATRDAPGVVTDTPWTGFLLRSQVVIDYPGLGVNVYPEGSGPDDPEPVLMPVRRLDRLGPNADTLLCLVEGDAYRVDVHEAPELLHYGIDDYAAGPPITANKNLHTFTREPDGTITLSKHTVSLPIGSCFRSRSPRVLSLTEVATQIAGENKPAIDSAVMGFEMTEGVGMVSFIKRGTT
jgi:hypothetical protein